MICKHKSNLNGYNHCYVSLTIQVNISHLFTHIEISNSSISNDSVLHKSFVCTEFKFQTNIEKALAHATSPGQSRSGGVGNEGVLRISQSSSITGASPSDCLMSYPGHLFGMSYPYAEIQTVYSTAPADWAAFMNNWNSIYVCW